MACYLCKDPDKETRPYGPGGQDVCVPCVDSDPELEKIVKGNFGALLEASSTVSPTNSAVLTNSGPQPISLENIKVVKCYCVPDNRIYGIVQGQIYIDGKLVDSGCIWPNCPNGEKENPNANETD